ncbi:hypothetical protein OR263_31940 [Streptomyces sp. NEAU-H22]|nr:MULTISPECIES: hypothetical protein [unclassified Streptomyces]MCX3291268.1 hypothetical protein [Streptomyces sp. NEAU-H22]WMD03258.1 hypothetical protein Q7C01_02180 [Streptomyces sp. FXY-T5]
MTSAEAVPFGPGVNRAPMIRASSCKKGTSALTTVRPSHFS